MYLNTYKKICNLFNTIYEGLCYMNLAEKDEVSEVANNCIEGLEIIKQIINEEETADKSLSAMIGSLICMIQEHDSLLAAYCEIEEIYYETIVQKLEGVYSNFRNLIDAKLKVVFLPYKAEMWTALESIWEEARKDEDCIVKVMPIPYVEAGNDKIIYEGERFPEYVPIVDYREYNLEEEKPDIIYIHNPYDYSNKITSVLPKFYSKVLKDITDMLVYVPYFIFGPYKITTTQQGGLHYRSIATMYAHKVIAQSERVKELFEYHGVKSDKILALGSPKSDAIIKNNICPTSVPNEWLEKTKGKKVILLNTHLSNIPRYGEIAVKGMNKIIDIVLKNENCVLLWRPHPLMELMLKTYAPQFHKMFLNMKEKVIESDRGILDSKGSYLPAFAISDAMITTYSSLIREYMITEKPILIAQQKRNPDLYVDSPVDIFCNYFINGDINRDKEGIDEFLEMIIDEKDYQKGKRLESIHKGLLNLDGTCGEKVHEAIKNDCIENI